MSDMRRSSQVTRDSERRDARITFRAPESLREALEREAAEQRRSISDVVTIILTDALAKRPLKAAARVNDAVAEGLAARPRMAARRRVLRGGR